MKKHRCIKWGGIVGSTLFLSACSPPAFFFANVTEDIRAKEYNGVENIEVSIGKDGEEDGYSLGHGRTLTITNHSEHTIQTTNDYTIYIWDPRWLFSDRWMEEELPEFSNADIRIEPGESEDFYINTNILELNDRILWNNTLEEDYLVTKDLQFIDEQDEVVAEDEVMLEFRLTTDSSQSEERND